MSTQAVLHEERRSVSAGRHGTMPARDAAEASQTLTPIGQPA